MNVNGGLWDSFPDEMKHREYRMMEQIDEDVLRSFICKRAGSAAPSESAGTTSDTHLTGTSLHTVSSSSIQIEFQAADIYRSDSEAAVSLDGEATAVDDPNYVGGEPLSRQSKPSKSFTIGSRITSRSCLEANSFDTISTPELPVQNTWRWGACSGTCQHLYNLSISSVG
ncbi:hypothetical protein Moror_9915 [Moniliophthora roreri MCA 2997]|uniref:Uncharacterized protein n=1 Tax=Moniliophthora roreri (strain MCA 2997) TaxID=1381753 RepID=V2WFU4_MONRO|nr:hypothetical protein Moror_9915 [Moniliophthora roreri MCA 2997]